MVLAPPLCWVPLSDRVETSAGLNEASLDPPNPGRAARASPQCLSLPTQLAPSRSLTSRTLNQRKSLSGLSRRTQDQGRRGRSQKTSQHGLRNARTERQSPA